MPKHLADIYANPLTPRALQLVKERDRLRAINAELVEAIEMLLVVSDAAGANFARAAIKKAEEG